MYKYAISSRAIKLQTRLYQFHKGTIKTLHRRCESRHYPYFNSIKVRLKHADTTPSLSMYQFQFHKGTIKSLPSWATSICLSHFNSIKVRLKPIFWGYITSLFSIGFADAKLINLIEKMSMGDCIFLCVLRQPLYLLVLRQVKDLNDAWE